MRVSVGAADSMARELRPPSRAVVAARTRWIAASSSVRMRSDDELISLADSLRTRLEHTSVSTWHMHKWVVGVTSDLVRVASMVSDTNGVT